MKAVEKQHESNGKRLGGCTGKGFMPGQSGNPGGRARGRTLMSVIREMLSKPDGNEKGLEQAAKAFVGAMKRGSFPHLKEYIEREEGKLPENTNVTVEMVFRRAELPGHNGNGELSN